MSNESGPENVPGPGCCPFHVLVEHAEQDGVRPKTPPTVWVSMGAGDKQVALPYSLETACAMWKMERAMNARYGNSYGKSGE